MNKKVLFCHFTYLLIFFSFFLLIFFASPGAALSKSVLNIISFSSLLSKTVGQKDYFILSYRLNNFIYNKVIITLPTYHISYAAMPHTRDTSMIYVVFPGSKSGHSLAVYYILKLFGIHIHFFFICDILNPCSAILRVFPEV